MIAVYFEKHAKRMQSADWRDSIALDSHSGGTRVESQSECRLSWQDFRGISQSTLTNAWIIPLLGHDHFLPNPFQFFACHLLSPWPILQLWKCKQYVPPKHRLNFNGLHGVISQKIVVFITTGVRTSTPTFQFVCHPTISCFIVYSAVS
jgi:hypothetical protein